MTSMFNTPAMYLVAAMFAAACIWTDEAILLAALISYRVQLSILNWRMRRIQWRMYQQLCRDAKTLGLPAPPPFRFIPLQDRER